MIRHSLEQYIYYIFRWRTDEIKSSRFSFFAKNFREEKNYENIKEI